MRQLRTLLIGLCLFAASTVGCTSVDSTDLSTSAGSTTSAADAPSSETQSTTEAPPTTSGNGVATPETTTTAAASGTLSQIGDEAAMELVVGMAEVGESINNALNEPDETAFAAMFRSGATFTDPVNPTMTPGPRLLHELYGGGSVGSDALAQRYPARALPHGDSVLESRFGNGHGAATVVYFEVGEPVGQLPAIRQTPIRDGKAEWGMHRLEVETLRTYPAEIVALLYLPETDTESAQEIVLSADEFIVTWTRAWEASDADAFAAIYASGAQRHDALAGSRTGDEIATWWKDLLATHPEATIDVADVYTSTSGPAAVYTINASAQGEPCAMTILTVWNLDESGLITDEFTYYDPETVLACGWTS